MNPPSSLSASLAMLAGATFFAGSADATNLVVNGSFEDTTGWTGLGTLYNHPYNGISGIKIADTDGGQSTAATGNFDFNSLTYGYKDDLSLTIGPKFHGLLGGSQTIPQSALTSVVSLEELDAGGAAFCFSSWLASWSGDGNTPALRVRFFSEDNGAGTVLGSEFKLDRGTTANQFTTAQFAATANYLNGAEDSRTDPDYWAFYEIKSVVPAGARSAIIEFVNGTGHAASGSNDWYAEAVVFDVVSVPVLRWTGAAGTEWSTAAIPAPKNWVQLSAPATGVDFTPLNPVVFGETGARTVSIQGADVLPAAVAFNHPTGNYSLTGTHGIGGATGLVMSGAGTLTLANPNPFSGPTQVSSGNLVIAHPLALENSTLSASFGGGSHTFGAVTEATLGGLAGDADLELLSSTAQPVALTLGANGASASYGGEITGTGSIIKTGAGMQTIFYTNTYSGGTTVASGILSAGSTTALGTGPVTSTGGLLEFEISGGAESTFANDIVLPGGTGALRMFASFGSGHAAPTSGTAVRLTGKISGGDPAREFRFSDTGIGSEHDNATIFDNAANDFTGIVFLNRATTAFTSDGALGNAGNDIVHFSENLLGKLRFDANNIVLNPGRTVDLPAPANARPIDTQAFTGTIAGPVSGSGTLVKQGEGKLILSSSSSTFTGVVTVAAGTLQVDGTIPTAEAAVTVNAAAILTGGGTVQRPVVLAGGSIAPGAGVGRLQGLTSLAFGASSTYAFEVADWTGAPGSGYDSVAAATVNITADSTTPVVVTVKPSALVNFTDTPKTFTLVATTAGITGFTAGAFTVDATALPAAVAEGWSVRVQGNNLVLAYGEPTGTPFQTWATSKGLSGNDSLFGADPDKDGISNGLEFVLGGEPNAANSAVNSAGLLPVVSRGGAGDLVFVYRRADAAVSLAPTVQFGADPAGPWTTAINGNNGVTIGNPVVVEPGVSTIEVRIPAALASGGKLFARLMVAE